MLRLAIALSLAAPGAAADFTPRFFVGASEGRGTLKILLRRPEPIHVRSQGRLEPDGTLVLDQVVTRGDDPPAARQWRIREIAPGRYAGTLSDAAGPVSGETRGDRLILRFRMKGGVDAEQVLTLASAGTAADNAMTVRKWGVTVARLTERIERR